jgi:hypothetical protein
LHLKQINELPFEEESIKKAQKGIDKIRDAMTIGFIPHDSNMFYFSTQVTLNSALTEIHPTFGNLTVAVGNNQ